MKTVSLLSSCSLAILSSCAAPTPSVDVMDAPRGAATTASAALSVPPGQIPVQVSFMIDFPGSKVEKYYDVGSPNLRACIEKLDAVTVARDLLYNPTGPYSVINVTAENGLPKQGDLEAKLNAQVQAFNDSYKVATSRTELFFVPVSAPIGGDTENYLLRSLTTKVFDKFEAERDAINKISCVRYEWVGEKLVAIYNYKLIAGIDATKPENFEVPQGSTTKPLADTAPSYCIVARFNVASAPADD